MSEGRNPLNYLAEGSEDGSFAPKVAIHEGIARTRQELEGLPADTMVTTVILEYTGVAWRHYALSFTWDEGGRERTEWFDPIKGLHQHRQKGEFVKGPDGNNRWEERPGRWHVQQKPLELDTEFLASLGPNCHDSDPETDEGFTEGACPNLGVAILNGVSGPGYALECERHKALSIDRYGPQLWRPVRCTKAQLDELLFDGALD